MDPVKADELARILLDAVEDYAVFTTDGEGRVDGRPPSACRLAGFTAEEVLGKPVAVLYGPADVEAREP